MHTIKGKKLLMLKPAQIKIPTDRVRKNIDRESIKSLAESISVNGVIEPIAVKKSEDGFYILIAGQRRLKGAVMAGLRRVPCVLYDLDNTAAILYSLTENLQRKPLDPFEEAQVLQRLITYCGLRKNEAALRLGLTQAELSYKLQLLDLEAEITDRLHIAGLKEEYARLLLLLPRYQRPEVLESIIEEKLSINDAKRVVELKINPEPDTTDSAEKVIIPPEPQLQKPMRKYAIGDVRMFANSLSKLTDTLKSAGITITTRKTENDKYIEYKVRIKKEPNDKGAFKQLSVTGFEPVTLAK